MDNIHCARLDTGERDGQEWQHSQRKGVIISHCETPLGSVRWGIKPFIADVLNQITFPNHAA